MQGGGFGLVAMDLGDTPPETAAPHLDDLLVPAAPGGGAYPARCWWRWSASRTPRPALRWCWNCGARARYGRARRAARDFSAGCGSGVERRKPVAGGAGVLRRARAEWRDVRLPARPGTRRRGWWNARRRFRLMVEETAPGTVVLDIDGLERLFGTPHEMAAAIARRAAEARYPGAYRDCRQPGRGLCAARGFAGVSIVPDGRRSQIPGQPAAGAAGSPAGDRRNAGALGHPPLPRPGRAARARAGGTARAGGHSAAPAGARGFERPLVPLEEPPDSPKSWSWNTRWSSWSRSRSCWRAC